MLGKMPFEAIYESVFIDCCTTHQVALQTDELYSGLQVLVGVPAENLDELHQICTEFVASLQNTQDHYVVIPKVIHDVVGQAFGPARANQIILQMRTLRDRSPLLRATAL